MWRRSSSDRSLLATSGGRSSPKQNDTPDSRGGVQPFKVFFSADIVYFVLGEVADTVVLQEVTSEDVVSLVDAMSQKFIVVTPSEEWSAQQKADAITAASPSTKKGSGCARMLLPSESWVAL